LERRVWEKGSLEKGGRGDLATGRLSEWTIGRLSDRAIGRLWNYELRGIINQQLTTKKAANAEKTYFKVMKHGMFTK